MYINDRVLESCKPEQLQYIILLSYDNDGLEYVLLKP